MIPSIAGLSEYVSVARETLQVWKKEKGTPLKIEFSNILESMLAKQERLLLAAGLQGAWNSNIVKLILGKHGYSDKLETDNKHKINSVSINIEYVEPNHNFNDLSEHEALPECGDRKLLACSGELQG